MKFAKLILLLTVGLLPFAWFAWASESSVSESGVIAAVDPATELRLAIYNRNRELQRHHVSTNQEYVDTVNRVGHRIAAAISERPDLVDEWEFTVVDTPQVINAVAFGGGKIIVYSGLLEALRVNGKIDEDMLASVLGHEIAHNVRSHIILSYSLSGSLDWILSHVDEVISNDASVSPELKEKLTNLAEARFTRVQEFEADALGALYATRAGYNGFGGAARWIRWAEINLPTYMFEYVPGSKSSSQQNPLDHPTWRERLANLERYKDQIAVLAGEFNWGCFALENLDFERAAVCFGDVVKVFPNSYEAQNNLGLAYHWLYLRSAGATEKFQPSLMNCFVSFRDRVRGQDTLLKAIAHYRKALELNPRALEPQANLAVALIETHDPDNLAEAEALLQKLVAKRPNDPTLLNDLAILRYWQAPPSGSERGAALAQVADAFRKAWEQPGAELKLRLPALYNLGVLELETGQVEQGVGRLAAYLKEQPVGPWAELAQTLIKDNHGELPARVAESSVPIKDILSVTPGMTEAEVVKLLGPPDQNQPTTTSEEDQGQVLYYRTIGVNVVLVEGKVASVNVFSPPSLNPVLGVSAGLSVAGIKLDGTVDELRKALGEPQQVTHIPGTGDDNYFYAGADGKTIVKVKVHFRRITGISLTSRKEA
ncbi:MAG: M48 family metalloprotease [Verrucomicrobia bacterium]|nr:M48 family metalloprotease [Verrucomicrobiota bacterium]